MIAGRSVRGAAQRKGREDDLKISDLSREVQETLRHRYGFVDASSVKDHCRLVGEGHHAHLSPAVELLPLHHASSD